jgi:hypothetical protein
LDNENKEPSSNAILAPRSWKERFHWLGVLIMAAFVGFAPAPPIRPPRDPSEYSQIAEDPDGLKLDPECHFLQNAFHHDELGIET